MTTPTRQPREADGRRVTTPTAPPRTRPTRGACGAGVTPCGAPARLYLCGWRCDTHAPNAKEPS